MAYLHNGEVHKEGIQNEDNVIDLSNELYKNGIDIYKIESDIKKRGAQVGDVSFEKRGSTVNKADMVAIDLGGGEIMSFSIKRKVFDKKIVNGVEKEIRKGTFDLINTTLSKFDENKKVFSDNVMFELEQYLENYRVLFEQETAGMSKEEKKTHIRNRLSPSFRKTFFKKCSEVLEKANEHVDMFIDLIKQEFYKTDMFIISKTFKNNPGKIASIFYEREQSIKLFDEKYNKFVFESGDKVKTKSSRRLIGVSDTGFAKPTPYRLRLVLNNGLGAYYGISDANKTSVFCIKIQVDDVEFFINQMQHYDL